ncbi:tlde1 domain-containing protein [Pseudoalteromonas rubra]
MQADPVVQAPSNLQNYNAYSYVLNNPLSYTDPSGYLFKKLGSLYKKYWQGTVGNALRAIAKVPVLNAAAQIGIGIVCNAAAPACLGAYNAAQTYAVTGDFGAALKSGAISAASAYAFQQVGEHFKGEFGNFATAELSEQLAWAGSHALVGGVSSVLSGGKFGHGFIAAGFTKMAMGNAGFNMNNREWSAIAGRTAVAAIVGGTASAITGGKFSNGARTAAMMHLLNAEMRFNGKKLKWIDDEGNVKKEWDAVSGRDGATADQQNVKDVGPIPEGEYYVEQHRLQDWESLPDEYKLAAIMKAGPWPGGKIAWGEHRVWLSPEYGTETYGRSGFSIHGGMYPGSAGCIDLTSNMSDFVRYFKSYNQDIILKVNYE